MPEAYCPVYRDYNGVNKKLLERHNKNIRELEGPSLQFPIELQMADTPSSVDRILWSEGDLYHDQFQSHGDPCKNDPC